MHSNEIKQHRWNNNMLVHWLVVVLLYTSDIAAYGYYIRNITQSEEEFDDTKGEIRNHKLKDRQHNGQTYIPLTQINMTTHIRF